MEIHIESGLKLSDVFVVREVRSAIAQFNILSAKPSLTDQEQLLLAHAVNSMAVHLEEHCSLTGVGSFFDLPDAVICECAKKAIGLADDEAKKSGLASPNWSVQAKPASPVR